MIQVRIIDENGFYAGEIEFVNEVLENMVALPLLVGYIKPRFDGAEWVEGATEEEIEDWKRENSPQEPHKSENEILRDEVEQLKQEKSILAQNVYDMATILEYIILGGAE